VRSVATQLARKTTVPSATSAFVLISADLCLSWCSVGPGQVSTQHIVAFDAEGKTPQSVGILRGRCGGGGQMRVDNLSMRLADHRQSIWPGAGDLPLLPIKTDKCERLRHLASTLSPPLHRHVPFAVTPRRRAGLRLMAFGEGRCEGGGQNWRS
jgi:hypothetical protein